MKAFKILVSLFSVFILMSYPVLTVRAESVYLPSALMLIEDGSISNQPGNSAPEDTTAPEEEQREERRTFLTDIKNAIASLLSPITNVLDNIKSAIDTVKNVADTFSNLYNDAEKAINGSSGKLATIFAAGGGYDNFVSKDLNKAIASIYNCTYPFGVAVMIVCWVFGCAKHGLTSALDMSDKYSILRSLVSLIVGLAVLSLAPQIMTVGTSASYSLCRTIWVQGDSNGMAIISEAGNALGFLIFEFVVCFVLMLNILYMAFLQAVSPIFVGFFGGESTKKLGFNFCKEYAKCLLVPPFTMAYTTLALHMMKNSANAIINGWSLIAGLVIGISAIGFAGKKLDRLIN